MGRPGSSRGADYMRGFTWGVQGEKAVMVELNRQLEGIKIRSERGLVMAAAHIRNVTETTPPLTPVDFGNLRNTYFVVTASKVKVGAGSKQFLGPNAAQMSTDHSATIVEAQGAVRANSTNDLKFIMMGYTANYSGYVHEMIGANFNPENRKGKARRRPGAGPKWLESAIKNNMTKIVEIVRNEAKIK